MLKGYLDDWVYNLIVKNFSFKDINEIRMRVNENIIICIKNKKYYLKNNNEFVKATKTMIDNFLLKASEHSLYAFNDAIKNGYITLKQGIRVGVCGYVVKSENQVVTIKDFYSINIRIPHEIKNCSLIAYDFIAGSEVKNTLIISSPGAGKTTFLRDFVWQLYQHNIPQNVLIVDERNEICCLRDGESFFDFGAFCDVYTNCDKSFALNSGIRSMNPDVIITDEIDLNKDMEAILSAINCGVKVVATIHAKDIEQLKKKNNFDAILKNKLFERFVILSKDEGPGTLTYIYDENLNPIYFRS